jgi:hypothetical protein
MTTAEYLAAAWLAKKVRAGFPIGASGDAANPAARAQPRRLPAPSASDSPSQTRSGLRRPPRLLTMLLHLQFGNKIPST